MKRLLWILPALTLFLAGCVSAPPKTEYKIISKYTVLEIDRAKLQEVGVPPPPSAKDFVQGPAKTPQEKIKRLESQRAQLMDLSIDLYGALTIANGRLKAIAKAQDEKLKEVERLNQEALQKASQTPQTKD